MPADRPAQPSEDANGPGDADSERFIFGADPVRERWMGRPLAETRGWLELGRILADPVLYGVGVQRGDGRPVVLMPGFLAGDQTLMIIAAWLQRIGYRPQLCGFVTNAGCSDRTLDRLEQRVEGLWRSYGRRVALIGHSRGGHFARALAARRLSVSPTPPDGRAEKAVSPATADVRSAATTPGRSPSIGPPHEHLFERRRRGPLAMPGDSAGRLHRGNRQPHRTHLQPQGLPGGRRRPGASRVGRSHQSHWARGGRRHG